MYAMEFFIQKLCAGRTDYLAHLQFERYSRGIFADKAIVRAKVTGTKYLISTTSEYANEFVRALAEELGSEKTHVEGVIISTKELPKEIKYNGLSQFMGVKKYAISGEFSGNEILSICDSVPSAFVA